jgi:hypothetical protein
LLGISDNRFTLRSKCWRPCSPEKVKAETDSRPFRDNFSMSKCPSNLKPVNTCISLEFRFRDRFHMFGAILIWKIDAESYNAVSDSDML